MAKKNSLQDALNKSIFINVALAVAVVALAGILVYTTVLSPRTTAVQQGGSTLNPNATNTTAVAFAGINQPFNATELAAINNEPLSNYEIAGQRLLNGTLNDQVVVSNSPQYNALLISGKPTVIYIGAISCIFCGENRWSMALALAKFGNFTSLYKGYSSKNDGAVPTVYWAVNNVTTLSGVTYGNHYSSNLINFVSAEYDSPISQGFQVQPLTYFVQHAPNSTYGSALQFMNATGKFQGTPFTFWGSSLDAGADAVVFGNTTPSSATLPLSQMTHDQILNQLRSNNDQFAWAEYAGADVYIAQACPSISNSAPVCALPAIKKIGAIMGLSS